MTPSPAKQGRAGVGSLLIFSPTAMGRVPIVA